ncbi:Uncharacterised protein [Mycobacteroides abscessus]|nr:Uncharacterised protein [Mycobacteroides abscessus]
MSNCTAYTSSPELFAMPAWNSRPCCRGVSGKTSATGKRLCNPSICCWLSLAGRISDGVNPPPPRRTCAQMPASASNHSRLILVTAMRSSAVGAHVQVAFRCGPVSVSMVTALSSTV